MSFAIPNTTTLPAYDPSTTFPVEQGAGTPFASGYIVIANNPATVSVLRGTGQGSASWGADFAYAPTTLPLSAGLDPTTGKIRDFIFGVRFKDQTPGTHAQVFGGLFQLGDVTLNPGQQFTGTIAPGGGFTPPSMGTMITGAVSAAGGVVSGSGFGVVHGGPGIYAVTFSTPFAAPPTMLCDVIDVNGGQATMAAVPLVGGVTVNTAPAAGGAFADRGFSFVAFATL